eukprot:Unigene10926_Nuclearia_a/m.33411 Unigene10926_Nuclearia_a/g.33411  ORF Unigene10926_Nuclearia_a/g.33411 Unigene10926_Nuclearia_a/m.33411 type:complete len:419 (-) Unigene10926_Nuclearia_a:54-1310(-)
MISNCSLSGAMTCRTTASRCAAVLTPLSGPSRRTTVATAVRNVVTWSCESTRAAVSSSIAAWSSGCTVCCGSGKVSARPASRMARRWAWKSLEKPLGVVGPLPSAAGALAVGAMKALICGRSSGAFFVASRTVALSWRSVRTTAGPLASSAAAAMLGHGYDVIFSLVAALTSMSETALMPTSTSPPLPLSSCDITAGCSFCDLLVMRSSTARYVCIACMGVMSRSRRFSAASTCCAMSGWPTKSRGTIWCKPSERDSADARNCSAARSTTSFCVSGTAPSMTSTTALRNAAKTAAGSCSSNVSLARRPVSVRMSLSRMSCAISVLSRSSTRSRLLDLAMAILVRRAPLVPPAAAMMPSRRSARPSCCAMPSISATWRTMSRTGAVWSTAIGLIAPDASLSCTVRSRGWHSTSTSDSAG